MSVTRNFGPLDQIPLTTKAIMREVGLLARERVVRRTRQGQTTEGGRMQPYSPSYAKRKGKELGTTQPNLTVSGAMLNDIVLQNVQDDEVTLGFSK
jgi:hypothetical protein